MSDTLSFESEVVDRADPQVFEVQGRVDFDDVTFAYVAGRPVLQHIDLHVAPGETIAFVGHTGAGKTTITSLVSRGYEVTGGAIRIDGHDLRDIKRRSLESNRKAIADAMPEQKTKRSAASLKPKRAGIQSAQVFQGMCA